MTLYNTNYSWEQFKEEVKSVKRTKYLGGSILRKLNDNLHLTETPRG